MIYREKFSKVLLSKHWLINEVCIKVYRGQTRLKKNNNRNIKNVLVERFILSVEIPKIIENCFYNVDMFLRLIFIDWKQSDKIP